MDRRSFLRGAGSLFAAPALIRPERLDFGVPKRLIKPEFETIEFAWQSVSTHFEVTTRPMEGSEAIAHAISRAHSKIKEDLRRSIFNA
ncbi:MAG: hypothetical protein AAGE80_05650 [Pseudomonadota bacterium]